MSSGAFGFAMTVAWIVTTFVEQPLLRARPFQSFFEKRPKRSGGESQLRKVVAQ